MLRAFSVSASAILFCAGLAACDPSISGWGEWAYDDYDDYDYYDEYYDYDPGIAVTPIAATVSGDLGGLGLVEPVSAVASGTRYADETEIVLTAQSPTRYVYTALTVWAPDGLASIPPGATETFGPETASVMGCTGLEPFVWDLDILASSVAITAALDPEDPRITRYTFEATFDELVGGSTTLRGTFGLVAP